jgi:TonB family protein
MLAAVALSGIVGRAVAAPLNPVAVSYKVTLIGPYINFADADVKPKPVHFQKAVYPPDLRAAGIEGFALTEFVVDTAGVPTQVQIVRATDRAFAVAALVAMTQWRFSAGMKNGMPVPCLEQIPIEFKIRN